MIWNTKWRPERPNFTFILPKPYYTIRMTYYVHILQSTKQQQSHYKHLNCSFMCFRNCMVHSSAALRKELFKTMDSTTIFSLIITVCCYHAHTKCHHISCFMWQHYTLMHTIRTVAINKGWKTQNNSYNNSNVNRIRKVSFIYEANSSL